MFSVGIVVLALLFVTCNFGQSASDLPVEYTDIVYSADGTQVTLYLDGVGVPVTQQQRALTLDMAKMAHDFYEAVFWCRVSGTDIIARTTWEIGQSAGISGVYKGTNPADGYIYTNDEYPATWCGIACLLVGRKVDKTLLACGKLIYIDDESVNDFPFPKISSKTKSVTFEVEVITTKLILKLKDEDEDDSETSFVTASGDDGLGALDDGVPYNSPNAVNTKANNMAEKVSLGGVQYPYYKLPKTDDLVAAQYYFGISSSESAFHYGYIRIISLPDGSIKPEVIKREPRFLSGGQYYYAQAANIDTGTEVIFANSFTNETDAVYATNHYGTGINFTFNTKNSRGGIFSFTFRIPLYNLTYDPSDSVIWYLQPSFGRDLYSLDNGENAGGCVLMGTEDSIGDMMDIFTAGMPW